jgi:hypothetical protein
MIGASEPQIGFIIYTKGTRMYVTSPLYEHQFLNWLNDKGGGSSGYIRETIDKVGVVCCPQIVHQKEEKSATVLKLVKDDVSN